MDRQKGKTLISRTSQAKCREVNQSKFPYIITDVAGTRMEEIVSHKGLHREKLEILEVTTGTAQRSQKV